MPLLCLVMIVKNEAAVLARCLRSVKPLIDRWCIVDTGSVDDTRTIVRDELEDVPGMLFNRPWVNFGHNRTEALEVAIEHVPVEERAHTWALLLDADHELVDEGFDKSALSADVYTLLQRDSSLEYPNVRLLRMHQRWVCEEPTHEYWPQPAGTPLLKTLSIKDHNDGSSHAEKYERDKQLLLEDLKRHPTKERSVFYLAQTLEGMGDVCADDLYRLRATMGGYLEEAWLARYRAARRALEEEAHRIEFGRSIGRTFLQVEDSRGVPEMLRVAAEWPARAEPLWRLAHFYRVVNLPTLGWLFAKRAQAIPKPEQALFLEHWCYDVGVDQELSICSYYAGDVDTGLKACERLEHIGDGHGRLNAHWYAPVIAADRRGSYEIPLEMRTFDGIVYHCSNPSACGELTCVRLVGYKQTGGRIYWSLCPDGKIKTRNAILRSDGAATLLHETLPADWHHAADILGLEDVRLSAWQGRVWFTATCCQTPRANGLPRVVLGRLSEYLTRVEHVVAIDYGERIEKNWLLWPDGERLRCIYTLSPFVVLDLDPETGAVLSMQKAAPWTAPGRFRGSAPPLRLPSGHWMAVAHDVAHQESGNTYTHRLVAWKDDEFFATSPFLLEHRGIEYCAGMSLTGETLRLSYGYEDREAKWLEISVTTALQLLGIEPA